MQKNMNFTQELIAQYKHRQRVETFKYVAEIVGEFIVALLIFVLAFVYFSII